MATCIHKIELAFVFVTDKQNKVLVGTKNTGRTKGKLVFPGGITKLGEQSKICACRQLFTQTSMLAMKFNLKHLIKVNDSIMNPRPILHEISVFQINLNDCIGGIRNSQKLSKLQFIAIPELPLSKMHPIVSALMPELFQENHFFQMEILKEGIHVQIKMPQAML